MTFYKDNVLLIRNMQSDDATIIAVEECAQGWDSSEDKYLMRCKDQSEGRAVSLVAEYKNQIAGYINVYPNSEWGAFGGLGLPEIMDFGVLEKFRKLGIGTRLMDVAEMVARNYGERVYLGVGLHSGYGSAQRMYVKRGYIPDGSGVWYQDKVCGQYEECCNDDDLVLYFIKNL